MNNTELFAEVRSWLENEKLAFLADEEGTSFQMRMNLDNGLIPVRLLCEEAPPILQVICSIPVKVPKAKISSTGLVLHRLNLRLRVGAFHLEADAGLVLFRLAQPILAEADMEQQFRDAFGVALNIVDDHVPPLALHFCATPSAHETLANLRPVTEMDRAKPTMPKARFEWN
jgi:hypothetical protein